MQVTKGTWRMREQCVPGSLSSSPTREPGNEARSSLISEEDRRDGYQTAYCTHNYSWLCCFIVS